MLTIIHGDDIATSRNHYITLHYGNTDSVTIQSGNVTITDLTQIFQGGGLFSEAKQVFIEDLFAKKKSGDELKAILKLLTEQDTNNTIVLWESKELTKTQLGLLKNATVRLYKLPHSLFQFLDVIKPKNPTPAIQLFHKTCANTEKEMILFMLIRHFRLLLALHDAEANIDETKRMAPWQKTKLLKQSRLFTSRELLFLYRELGRIDTEMKTGQLSLPLTSQIDILLLGL